MKNNETLSISSYYGGKGRMAHFIAERLNYDCDVFVTPFGGMCRELLNKPRHRTEIYNDYNTGLCALMSVLSVPDKADEFIHRLCAETEATEECFLKHKAVYDSADSDLEQQTREELRRLLVGEQVVVPIVSNKLMDEILWSAYTLGSVALDSELVKQIEEQIEKLKTPIFVKEGRNNLRRKLKTDDVFRAKFQHLLENWIELDRQKDADGYLPRPADMGVEISEMDLAIATYVTFKMSRDGMGKVFSAAKFKTADQYLSQVVKLYECAERLEGVAVCQIDAMDFFRRWPFFSKSVPFDAYPASKRIINEWINNPHVMMYCDPSYIKPEHEAKLLNGININSVSNVSAAIMRAHKKLPKNLGTVYSRSFGYEEQESFLQCIQNAQCKIMVSNYDLALYNKYLNSSTGWRREEYLTSTSVGGKSNNKRVEVIWYNY